MPFLILAAFLTITHTTRAYALDPGLGLAQFDAVVSFLAAWMVRVGGLVLFLGVIQFALAVHNQSADGKINGALVVIAGAMVLGVGLGYQFFTNPS